MNTSWAAVQKPDLPEAWDLAQPFIERALREGMNEFSLKEIVLMLERQDAQLWLIGNDDTYDVIGACVTQIQIGDGTKLLNIFLCAGEHFDLWEHHIEAVEEWGHSQGCDYVRIHGRRGWKKKLSHRGYKEKYVVLAKPLFRSH